MKELLLIASILLTSCASQVATSAPVVVVACDFRDELAVSLYESFGEYLVGFGQNNLGGFIELFVNDELKTWSIVVTRPDGWSCIAAAGKGWDVKTRGIAI